MAGVDTALAIPGLFLTCLEYFKLARLAHDFKEDFGDCLLTLRATEIRLHRWGNAAGITDEHSETFVKQLQSKYPPQEIVFAHNACKQILKKLSRAKEDSQDIMDMNHGAAEELERETVDELERMQICGPKASRASRVLKSVKSGYERSHQFTERTTVRGKWALYKKTELTALVATIGEHVTTLETLFPQKERELAAAEATQMDRDTIELMAPISIATDPILEKALQAEAPAKGFSWDKVRLSGYATGHYGNNYATQPENEVGASWNDLEAKDHANMHAGMNYGYATVPALTPHAVVGAYMDDPNYPHGSGQARIVR